MLSHDDHDHAGNLETAIELFPNATIVASWWINELLTGIGNARRVETVRAASRRG